MVKLRKILLPSIAIFAAVAVTYQLGLANAGKAR
jgi:hypothetical protein